MSINNGEIILQGINASPGICIGKAYIVDKEGVDVIDKYFVSKDDLKNEIKRFKIASKKARNELGKIIKDTSKELHQHAYILETHLMILKDKKLYDRIIEIFEKEHVNAEWALKKVTSELTATFQSMSNPYLKARADDIAHVADRIMRNLVGAKKVDISDINKRVILVSHDLSPAETSQIQLEKIKGFVTNLGGKASHTSIIARTLEIPAVIGLDNATSLIKNDDLIIVDGTRGIVIIHPSEQTLLKFSERKAKYEKYKIVIARNAGRQAETTDGFIMQVMGNIELPEEVVSVIGYGGDGIGLYRTEFQYLSRPVFPDEDELFDKYKDVVEVMAPKPVTIRTLDINGDKAIACASDYKEANPALGLRAIRYCLKRPDVFKTQIRAILKASAFGNVRILLPMISSYNEIIDAKRILNEVAEALEKEGIPFNPNIETGIMIEVPSAVVMADAMAKEVDFFSIGTNDLIQYSLAIDRGNKQVAYLYNPLHPAIITMIKHTADAAKNNGIKIFMCGEMAGELIHIPILLGLGLDELSMNPQSIPTVKSMIRSLDIEDSKMFINKILKQNTASDIMKLVNDTYGSLISDKIYKE